MVNEEQNITQTQLDIFDAPLTIPTNKLDADQYSADDLDGVTESLFGSGNMAYGILQASQSNAALLTNDPSFYNENSQLDFGSSGFQNGAAQFNPIDSGSSRLGNERIDTDTDRGIAGGAEISVPNTGSSDGNFASSTVGSVSASQLSSDIGSFSSASSGLSLSQGLNGVDGETPDVPDISSPTNGVDGQDGVSVGTGDTTININLGDTIELLDTTINELGDTITTLTTTVTDVTEILGDVLNNLTNNLIDLSEVTNLVTNITQELNQTITNTLIEITNVTTTVTNLVDGLLGGDGEFGLSLDLDILDTAGLGLDVPLTNLLDTNVDLNIDLDPAYSLANDIADLSGLDFLGDTLAELNATVEVLQATVNQVTDVVSDLDLNDPGATVEQLVDTLENLDETVASIASAVDDSVGGILNNLGIGDEGDSVEDLLSDVVSGNLDDVVTDAVDGLTGGLLDNELLGDVDDALGDIVTGLGLGNEGDGVGEVVDGVLSDLANGDLEGAVTDVVDGLLDGGLFGGNENSSDTDLSIGLGEESLDVNLDLVENIVGDIDIDLGLGGGLFGGDDETNNNDGDEDVGIETGIDLVDNTILDEGLDAALDPVEEIIGDLDLGLGVALDLLGGNNGTDNDSEDSGGQGTDDDTSWTDSTIGEGGLFDDLVDGLGGAGDVLPDPIGTVGEGLGILDTDPDAGSGGGLLGGLFG